MYNAYTLLAINTSFMKTMEIRVTKNITHCVARCILMERMKYTGTQESSRVEGASVAIKGEDVEEISSVEVEEAKVLDEEDSEAVEALVEEGRVLGLPLRALPVMSSRGSWSVWRENKENLEF